MARSSSSPKSPATNGKTHHQLADGQLRQLQRMASRLGQLKVQHSDAVIHANRLAVAVVQLQQQFEQLGTQMAQAQGLDTAASDYDLDLQTGHVTARPRP